MKWTRPAIPDLYSQVQWTKQKSTEEAFLMEDGRISAFKEALHRVFSSVWSQKSPFLKKESVNQDRALNLHWGKDTTVETKHQANQSNRETEDQKTTGEQWNWMVAFLEEGIRTFSCLSFSFFLSLGFFPLPLELT